MILYRRRALNDTWVRAPLRCLEQQAGGWLYRYFENDEAAQGTTYKL